MLTEKVLRLAGRAWWTVAGLGFLCGVLVTVLTASLGDWPLAVILGLVTLVVGGAGWSLWREERRREQ
ncbi:MAG TPA: hypothetical protein VFW65_31860 [Pseudonocardiaceae bacterium]|nr:hypothetical protein [Pseudonocardiaceae bacterium]